MTDTWVTQLALEGWEFYLEDGRLRYRAPADAATPEVLARLKAHRDEIHARLTEQPDAYDLAPLSHGQRALWFLWLLSPESSAYHQSLPLRITAHVDPRVWRAAAEALVARHPALRTRIIDRDGEPAQHVRAVDSAAWVAHDARGWPPDEVTRAMMTAHARPFDLAGAPPVRFEWFETGADAVLLVTMHHIATDAWSFEILRREIEAAALAIGRGETWTPPALPARYRDYVFWQRAVIESAEGARLWAYWAETLAEPRAVLDLPADRPRPAVPTYRGRSVTASCPPELARALTALARERAVTLHTLLLAGFAALLHRWTRQADLVVGTPTAGRSQPEWAPLVGYFVAPVPVRIRVPEAATFEGLLASTKSAAAGALAHADLPFPLMVERLKVDRDPSRSPIFDVTFNFLSRRAAGDGGLRDLPLAQADGKFDLTLTVVEEGDALRAAFGYNVDLFDQSTIERLAESLIVLLTAAAADPDQALDALPLGAAAAAPAIAGRMGDQARLVPVPEAVAAWAARTPDAIAVAGPDGTLTYRELLHRADAIAARLRTCGCGPGGAVGLVVPRSRDFIAGLLGIWRAGAAYVPIDPRTPRAAVDAMLETAGARATVGPAGLVTPREAGGATAAPVDPLDALAYVIFTSGSTGTPKGVEVPHRALANYVSSIVEDLAIEPRASHAFVSALGADLGHTAIFPALTTGGTLHIPGEDIVTDGVRFARFMHDAGIDYLKIVPSHLLALMEGQPHAVPRRAVILGGESTATAWACGLAARGACRVFNHYGPTETTVGVLTYEVDPARPPATPTLPLGRAVANTDIWLMDEAGRPVPPGMPGEIWVSGPCLARGYAGDEARTAERFVTTAHTGRAYRTGDLARRLPDGMLLVAGRVDRQVKVRGYRVEPGQIEAALTAHRAVRQAVVLPHRTGGAVDGLRAWATLDPDVVPSPGAEALTRWLGDHLPDYMVPSRIDVLERLPLTANGKVDVAALERAAPARAPREGAPLARDVIELTLAGLWREVLGEPPGPDTDFFEAGGHSLMAVRLASRMHTAWGIRLPLATFFTHRTLTRLAAAVREALDGGDMRLLVSLQPGRDAVPIVCLPGAGGSLLYFQHLIAALGVEVPVWGAQPPNGESGRSDVPALAARYAEALRCEAAIAPPYQLAGHSFGALVAFETACRLREAGEAVAWVAILDQPAPGATPVDAHDGWTRDDWERHIATRIERLYGVSMPGAEAIGTAGPVDLFGRMRAAGLLPPETSRAFFDEYVARYRANVRAAAEYRPSAPAAIPLLVVRAEDQDRALAHEGWPESPTLGWERWTSWPVRTVTVPGSHITMLTPPGVSTLARSLDNL
ncbi:MAG: amino acid adenylation domain-containing protein [Vicinamibacterales bacterium]|nr:amino acid adenylation domain-containing protein [Vicinamibacterales bacterium]